MIAALYARKSTDPYLWGWILAAWRWIDWTAVSSLATLAAVLVALTPIILESRRRAAMAEALRAQLMIQLCAVLPPLQKLSDKAKDAVTGMLTSDERQPIAVLQVLLGQVHILSKSEAKELSLAVPAWSCTRE